MAKVSKVTIQRLPNTRTLLASWVWKTNTSTTTGYHVRWWYNTAGIKNNILGEEKDVPYQPRTANGSNTQFTIPDNATRVWVSIQPYTEKTKKVNKKEVVQWKADWSTNVFWYDTSDAPSNPPVPSVKMEYDESKKHWKFTYKITNYTNDNYISGAKYTVKWLVARDDRGLHSKVIEESTIKAMDSSGYAWVDPGHTYKVKCQIVCESTINKKTVTKKSEWSEYSEALVSVPTAVSIDGERSYVLTSTSIQLEYSGGGSKVTSYDIEYSTNKEHFDIASDTTKVSDVKETTHILTGLETGNTYFIRVRGSNETGGGEWSKIVEFTIGRKPEAPTTWSNTTNAKVGEQITLYWMHNSSDGSRQRYAEIETVINGTSTIVRQYNSVDPTSEEPDEAQKYLLDMSTITSDTEILWRVRTSGVLVDETNSPIFGDWSIQRTVKVFQSPTVSLYLTDSLGRPLGQNVDDAVVVKTLPLFVDATVSPNTQKPVSYQVTIKSNEDYETVDNVGNFKMVRAGEEIYSKVFDINERLTLILSADNFHVENNVTYEFSCIAATDSGLTSDAYVETLLIAWDDDEYILDAEIVVDEDNILTYVRPFCVDDDGNEDSSASSNVIYSIYRKDYDGTFTPITEDITYGMFATDIHPALDYARYRIVCKSNSTGRISYYDPDPVEVGEKAAVIQWNEEARNFELLNDNDPDETPYVGTMLRLPYNLDVSESNNPDKKLVEYVGREAPVSYYGTQQGTSSDFSVAVPKDDTDTLYMLRKLQRWMGDVYIREPSGLGYWANITVSFKQTHVNPVISVTLKITKVEGGA